MFVFLEFIIIGTNVIFTVGCNIFMIRWLLEKISTYHIFSQFLIICSIITFCLEDIFLKMECNHL
jgi:hypothetical protein